MLPLRPKTGLGDCLFSLLGAREAANDKYCTTELALTWSAGALIVFASVLFALVAHLLSFEAFVQYWTSYRPIADTPSGAVQTVGSVELTAS